MFKKSYGVFVYSSEQYFQVSYFYNLSQAAVQYSLVDSTVFYVPDPRFTGPKAVLVVGTDQKYLVTGSYSNYLYQGPVLYKIDDAKKPVYNTLLYDMNSETIYLPTYLWADELKRYYFILGIHEDYLGNDMWVYYHYLYMYNYSLPTNCLANLSLGWYEQPNLMLYPIQFEDLLYIFPVTWNDIRLIIETIFVLNISDPTAANLQRKNMSIPGGYEIFKSGAGGCLKNGEKYLFIKYELVTDIYIYRIFNTNYTDYELITQIKVPYHAYLLKASEDCNYLYAGGDALLTIDIFDITKPKLHSTILIKNIDDMKVIKKKIYLFAGIILYIFTVNENGFLRLTSSAGHPVTDENYKYKIHGFDIYQTKDSNYIYKGSCWNDPKQGVELTIYQEKNLYFLHIINDKQLEIGVPITYSYYTLDLFQKCEVKGVLKSVYLTDASASFPAITAIPSWVQFDFNNQKAAITVPKSYQYTELSLLFEMIFPVISKEEKYSQTIVFPPAKCTLDYELVPKLQISTPDKNNIEIKIDHHSNINFVFLQFSAVFISYSTEKGTLKANGLLDAINEMLQNLRFTKINTSDFSDNTNTFNLSLKDNINNDVFGINLPYNESVFLMNQPPNCSVESLQDKIFEKFLYIVPLTEFSFTFEANLFSDPEGDKIYFSLSSQNSKFVPNWLSFDSENLLLFGTPQKSDEGIVFLSLTISDSFDFITRNFYLNVSNEPPFVKISLKNQLNTTKIKVGENLNFIIDPSTFQDIDGPNKLSITVFVQEKDNYLYRLDSSNDYWIKYKGDTLTLSGSPHFSDSNAFGNNITIIVYANDGIKNCSDNFTLQIYPSLTKSQNNRSNNGYLNISSLQDESLTAIISTDSGKLVLLNDFTANFSSKLSYETNEQKNQLKIVTTSEILNQAVKFLSFRQNKSRLLQESEPNITYTISDTHEQIINGIIPVKNIVKFSENPIINRSYIMEHYLAEIGTIFRTNIPKKILVFTEIPNMKMKYALVVKNIEELEQKWLLYKENDDNIEIYVEKNLDSSLFGNYKAKLILTDEFDNEYQAEFTIEIDYSFLEKLKNYLQVISSIIGPLISIFAFSKFFYLIYNAIWKNKIQRKDFFLKTNAKFKLKVPFIEKYFLLASNVFTKLEKDAYQINKKYFELFIEDVEIEPLANKHGFLQNANKYLEFMSKSNAGTVICLIEGMLIKKLVEKFPKASIVLKKLEEETKLKSSSDIDEWYNQFFLDSALAEEEDVKNMVKSIKFNFISDASKISSSVLQLGIYESLEKNVKILDAYYSHVFEKTLEKLKKKIKYSEKEKNILKSLILRAIISIKRGVPFSHGRRAFQINNIFDSIGFRILPYNFGDAIHLSDWEMKFIRTFQKIEDGNPKKRNKIVRKIMGSNADYLPFFSINEQSFPNWLKVKYKEGFIVFSGCPFTSEENKKYRIRIYNKNKYNILEFCLQISDISQNKAKAMSISKKMTIFKSQKIIETSVKDSEKFIMESTKPFKLPKIERNENEDFIKKKSAEIEMEECPNNMITIEEKIKDYQ